MFALKENPCAGIHIRLPKVQLQIQMEVIVQVKVGDITIPYWRDVPANSRVGYRTIPSPNKAIESPFAYNHNADQKRFAVLVCNIQ